MRTRSRLSLSAVIFVIVSVGVAAFMSPAATARVDDNAAFIGAWQGSWSGDGSGKFDMTIAKSEAGKLSGRISTRPDSGDPQTFEFKTVEVTSGKFTAKFEAGDTIEITITGSLDGKSLKGTYTARQTADGSQVDAGSWEATRK